MANSNRPCGFEPVGQVLRAQEYIAAATIYPGDLVKLTSAGKVDRCAATEAAVGVALAYASADGQKVLVADHPDQMFRGQADDATIDAQTDINQNYDIVVGTASTAYKLSRMQVDASTQTTSAGAGVLKVIAIIPEINNELGDKVDVKFMINKHQLDQSVDGI